MRPDRFRQVRNRKSATVQCALDLPDGNRLVHRSQHLQASGGEFRSAEAGRSSGRRDSRSRSRASAAQAAHVAGHHQDRQRPSLPPWRRGGDLQPLRGQHRDEALYQGGFPLPDGPATHSVGGMGISDSLSIQAGRRQVGPTGDSDSAASPCRIGSASSVSRRSAVAKRLHDVLRMPRRLICLRGIRRLVLVRVRSPRHD